VSRPANGAEKLEFGLTAVHSLAYSGSCVVDFARSNWWRARHRRQPRSNCGTEANAWLCADAVRELTVIAHQAAGLH